MAKFSFWLLLLIAAVLMWRIAMRRKQRKGPFDSPPPAPQRMVRCAECDVYLPESDALAADGRHFCGEAHRAAFAQRSSGPR